MSSLFRRCVRTLGGMQPIGRSPSAKTLLICAGALSYPLLIAVLFWPNLNVLNVESLSQSWSIAAEHGELELEHWVHFIVILLAAGPFSFVFVCSQRQLSWILFVAAPLFSALPYFVHPTWQYDASDSWLSGYAWQLDAVKIVLAPSLLAAVWNAAGRLIICRTLKT